MASAGGIFGLTYCWKLQVVFHDRHGNPHRDFDTGDPNDKNSSPSAVPQDTVTIPAANGSPWRICDDPDWNIAVTQGGFFGGDAVLSLEILDSSGNVLVSEQDYKFRIAGENPDPDICQAYIVSQYGGPTPPMRSGTNPNAWQGFWFADAIAREETANEGGRDFYNQFLDNGGGPPGKRSDWPGHEGRPNWNNDGIPTPQKGSGGYGLFQLTRQPTENTYIMPRKWIWNWQANVTAVLKEFQAKLGSARRLYKGLTATYPASGVIPNHLSFSGLETIVVTDYNGIGTQSPSQTKNINIRGYNSKRPTCWWPGIHSWQFLPNKENYVDKVNSCIDQ